MSLICNSRPKAEEQVKMILAIDYTTCYNKSSVEYG